MSRHTKKVEEKLKTKINNLKKKDDYRVNQDSVSVGDVLLFNYSDKKISYSKNRYYPRLKDSFTEEDFFVDVILTHETLKIVSGPNPARNIGFILKKLRDCNAALNHIVIGTSINKIEEKKISITYELFEILNKISKEENEDRDTKVKERFSPFFENNFGLSFNLNKSDNKIDYRLVLEEIIASGNLSENDIIRATDGLKGGINNEYVINQQIEKQASWLLDSISKILEEDELDVIKSKDLGSSLFGFTKVSIKGPEDLMEKILSKYGKNIIFGVPALINTNKYVVSQKGISNSQFDIILINHLSDIKIVELKRSDKYLLDYDGSRGKFFAHKDLSVAISQSERYISTIYRENDNEYRIDNLSIRDFIEREIGGSINLSICRPSALIVMGSSSKIAKPYEKLSSKIKNKVSRQDYYYNANQAYLELKSAYKNIEIGTYSDLVDAARLRLETN